VCPQLKPQYLKKKRKRRKKIPHEFVLRLKKVMTLCTLKYRIKAGNGFRIYNIRAGHGSSGKAPA
jgi:hypothetical protein